MDNAELERQYFARGKELLGNGAGGLLAQLLKCKKRNVALARAALEMAATKFEPKAYVAKIIKDVVPAGRKLAGGTDLNEFLESWELVRQQQLEREKRETVAADERAKVGSKILDFAKQLRELGDNA